MTGYFKTHKFNQNENNRDHLHLFNQLPYIPKKSVSKTQPFSRRLRSLKGQQLVGDVLR